MGCDGADRDDRHALWDGELRQERGDLRFAPTGRDEHHSSVGRGEDTGPGSVVDKRDTNLAREGGPEIGEGVAQPDDDHADVVRGGHRKPSSVAVTRASTA